MVVLDNLLQVMPTTRRPLGAELLEDDTGLGEFEELCWQYLHKLPSTYRLGRIKTHIENDPSAFGTRRYEFDSRIYLANDLSAEPEPVGQLMVTLYRRPRGADEDIYLELDQCQLWYPDMRGKGLGKTIVGLVADLGRHLSVKALTAIAIYDGRWVWPCLGFRFGDYLPEERIAQKYRRRFLEFCARYQITPPDVSQWDAPDFARFVTESEEIKVFVGHKMDRQKQAVAAGRAFLLSRRPFFLSYPLT